MTAPRSAPSPEPFSGTLAINDTRRRQVETLAFMWLARYGVKTTYESYKTDLRLWFAFLDELGVDALEAHRTHGDLFIRDMEARGRMASTIARRWSTIHTFYEFLVDEDVLVKNPVRATKRPKVSKETTRLALSTNELGRWMNAAEDEGGYVWVLACLLGVNALRISEACNADVEDLGQERYHWTLRIVGKGDKPAVIALPAPVMMAIDGALAGRETGPLMLNTTGTRMDREAAARIVRRLCISAGIAKHITPHSLRHSVITALLNDDVPLRDVQHFARHEDPKTTARYDHGRQSLDKHGSYRVVQTVWSAR